jgi:hypothetical protein
MPFSVTITLNTIEGTPGPFNLYSCTGATCSVTPFETGVSLVSLQGGYLTSLVPNGTTDVKIKSTGVGCTYEIIKPITGIPTHTPTPTPTSTPTPTPTYTPTPSPTPITGAYTNSIRMAHSPYNLDKCQAYICYNNLLPPI